MLSTMKHAVAINDTSEGPPAGLSVLALTYPDMGSEELLSAWQNLERYLAVIMKIESRIAQERNVDAAGKQPYDEVKGRFPT